MAPHSQADAMRMQARLHQAACELSCGTRLILLLVKYRFSLDEDNMNVLASHWTPAVDDNLEQGWEAPNSPCNPNPCPWFTLLYLTLPSCAPCISCALCSPYCT